MFQGRYFMSLAALRANAALKPDSPLAEVSVDARLFKCLMLRRTLFGGRC